jgi:hypothetical protein
MQKSLGFDRHHNKEKEGKGEEETNVTCMRTFLCLHDFCVFVGGTGV